MADRVKHIKRIGAPPLCTRIHSSRHTEREKEEERNISECI